VIQLLAFTKALGVFLEYLEMCVCVVLPNVCIDHAVQTLIASVSVN